MSTNRRPVLYSSAIQHVLVLQEEEGHRLSAQSQSQSSSASTATHAATTPATTPTPATTRAAATTATTSAPSATSPDRSTSLSQPPHLPSAPHTARPPHYPFARHHVHPALQRPPRHYLPPSTPPSTTAQSTAEPSRAQPSQPSSKTTTTSHARQKLPQQAPDPDHQANHIYQPPWLQGLQPLVASDTSQDTQPGDTSDASQDPQPSDATDATQGPQPSVAPDAYQGPQPSNAPDASQGPQPSVMSSLSQGPQPSVSSDASPPPSPPTTANPSNYDTTVHGYPWRVRERLRTVTGALVLCLNIGVDPPGVTKPTPCARLEAWVLPTPGKALKSLQVVSASLKAQYERWQRRVRYRTAPDPTVTDLRRVCVALRRAAKDERVLFHYNGHGVPSPTPKGELWVFNHNFSQYIPLPVSDLHAVLGSPTLYVFDCNFAGAILYQFQKLTERHELEWLAKEKTSPDRTTPLPLPLHRHSMLLAACSKDEMLPTTPSMPADLFTSCLTTPIRTALRWFAPRSLIMGVTFEMLDRIPGSIDIRSTPLGELEYIFTAITDSIAWHYLDPEMFKKLFREDVLLSSLMRNFLLSQRIMASYGCTPASYPKIPQMDLHPLWESFDLAMENLLSQVPTLLKEEAERVRTAAVVAAEEAAAKAKYVPRAGHIAAVSSTPVAQGEGDTAATLATADVPPPITYRPSSFFENQMIAFDVWLDMGDLGPEVRDPPEQLPIMLQVLLSPAWRRKALHLISRYMQTGPLAVDLALAVGIFPYVLRLLSHQATEIRNDLVFIWSKILALDQSCSTELVRSEADKYFVRFLVSDQAVNTKPVYLACAMFVLSVVSKKNVQRSVSNGVLDACFQHLRHEHPFVRRWACLCMTEVLQLSNTETVLKALRWEALICNLVDSSKNDAAADVRAAALSTMAAIMNKTFSLLSAAEKEKSKLPEEVAVSFSSSRLGEVSGGVETSPTDTNAVQGADRRDEPVVNTGLLVAVVLPYSEDEELILMKIGAPIAVMAKRESSVLVRREVSNAIARAFSCREGRFLTAALEMDMLSDDEVRMNSDDLVRGGVDACDQVYRLLWKSLTELAFDPHPVDAAIARRSYDRVAEIVAQRSGVSNKQLGKEEDDGVDKGDVSGLGFARAAVDDGSEFAGPSSKTTEVREAHAMDSTNSTLREQIVTPRSQITVLELNVESSLSERHLVKEGASVAIGVGAGKQMPAVAEIGRTEKSRKGSISKEMPPVSRRSVLGNIHVRSPSGTFDLNMSSLVAKKVDQAGAIDDGADVGRKVGLAALRRVESIPTDLGNDRIERFGRVESSERERDGSMDMDAEEKKKADEPFRPNSLPHMALLSGVTNLVKTVSQQIGISLHAMGESAGSEEMSVVDGRAIDATAGGGSADSRGSSASSGTHGTIADAPGKKKDSFSLAGSSAEARSQPMRVTGMNPAREDSEFKAKSPPRPPRRTLSYQVLSTAQALSPKKEASLFVATKHTLYSNPLAASYAASEEEGSRSSDGHLQGHGYDKLFLSGDGNAALSLFEWSSAYIAKVEVESSSLDYSNDEDGFPRYVALWSKLNQRIESGELVADRLRAFALQGKGDDVIGIEATGDDEGDTSLAKNEFENARELSLHTMGAGGGAVTAMAFLPRDTGICDDQLVATGDSTGSLGVYDARTGKCKGAFGIPLAPGMPEAEVNVILCLNPHGVDNPSGRGSSNMNSALILAGAHDGRVAVFRSDFIGPYRIMSTFQACGRPKWGRRLCSQELSRIASLAGCRRLSRRGSVIEMSNVGALEGKLNTSRLQDSLATSGRTKENGLVLGFNVNSANLAAGGCDGPVVRVWDLISEQCSWEGKVVDNSEWPTAVTMWKCGNPNIFVVGGSDGRVYMVDMREDGWGGNCALELGQHKEAVSCIGTCPPGERSAAAIKMGRTAETVVSADVGGGLVFWDPRWRGDTGTVRETLHSVSSNPVQAHDSPLTAMCVHRTGRYIASGSSSGSSNCVKIFGDDGRMAKMITHYEGGAAFSPVTSLAFQHETGLLAMGCLDGNVMIYGRFRDLFPTIETVTTFDR